MIRKHGHHPLCPNDRCLLHATAGRGNVTCYGFYRVRRGRRRRYRCRGCGTTFSVTTNTPYQGLRHSRRTFDRTVALSAEGVSRSAIARAEGLTWNTVDRWLDRAASAARQFNHCRTHGFALRELQADELHTYAPTKARPTWVFTTIEVWSRLWVSTVVGRRSYRNTGALLTDTLTRSHLTEGLLITTDGFEYYARVIRQLLGPACVYGQVVKSWRQGRVVKVDKRLVIGTQSSLSEALIRSEDSSDLNTAYIERLNLTLRQSCAYLGRRRLTHARCETRVAHHLELLRCVYNFTRPHRAVRFGKVIRTPAMQAGLAIQRYSIRDIFLSVGSLPRKLASVQRITLRYPSCRLTRKLSTNTN